MNSLEKLQLHLIRDVIREARNDFMFEIAKGHRFFFVDQFYETKFKKKSANALLGIKYFDLANIEGFSAEMDTKKKLPPC